MNNIDSNDVVSCRNEEQYETFLNTKIKDDQKIVMQNTKE